jgi:superfamily I DNA and/or RNA helicase
MTLDGFIGMTMETGQLSADRIFVDEAAYAPLAKVLPLLSMKCPIALLGDHRQLPPVCENKNDPRIKSFWQTSAIFIETAFRFDGEHDLIIAANEPTHEQTAKHVLTRSYRFGSNLASLLDRAVYGNVGLTGLSFLTRIVVESCMPRVMPNEKVRRNLAEAEAIVAKVRVWLSWGNPDNETLAVLTPYKAQVRMIASLLQKEGLRSDGIEVLNVHKAQGREWDWVLFSVVDTDQIPLNRPWFTDDRNDQTKGREVLNTALSRAKKHLFLFMDTGFWKQRADPRLLLSQIARSSASPPSTQSLGTPRRPQADARARG